jgi:hypothetical protein
MKGVIQGCKMLLCGCSRHLTRRWMMSYISRGVIYVTLNQNHGRNTMYTMVGWVTRSLETYMAKEVELNVDHKKKHEAKNIDI